MRLTTRHLAAVAVAAGMLAAGAAPAATAATVTPTGAYTAIVHQSGNGLVTARCPLGYRATGGGVAIDHKAEIDTLYNRPTADGRGWEGRALGKVQPPKKADKRVGKKKGKAPRKEINGLPLTVYAVCSL